MKWRLVQILVSITFLAFIFLKIDFQKIFHIIQTINVFLFSLALLTSIASLLLNTKKWQILLLANEIFIPYRTLLKQNFLSIFYSIALVGQLSGELIKAYRITRGHQNKIKILSSILSDKISGILILFIMSAILPFFLMKDYLSPFLPFIFLSLSGAVIIFISFFIPTDFIDALYRRIKFIRIKKIIFHFLELLASYQVYRKDKRVVFQTLIISFLNQFLITISFLLVGESINIHLSLIQYFWIFSVLSISLLIPLSVAGLGIREESLVLLMGLFNVPPEQALGASLLLFIITIIMGGIGAILEILYVKK